MVDVGASLSGSSSATSGLQQDLTSNFGDVIVGGSGGASKGLPDWVWLAVGGLVFVGFLVWAVRR